MCTFIGVECLAANALIELYESGIQQISFNDLADYGLLVVENYEYEIGDEAIFIFDREKLEGMVINYSDLFVIREIESKKCLCLQDNVDISVVKERFRWTLSYAMIKAMRQVDIRQVVQNG